MFDNSDFIIKDYYCKKTGKHKPQRWVMHYCDICSKKKSYAPRCKSGKCISCACKGREITTFQKHAISKTLQGNQNASNRTRECIDAATAKMMKISLSDYINSKEQRKALRRLKKNMMDRLNRFVSGSRKTFKYLDYSNEELKKHLESSFKDGMSWDNYGRKKDTICWEIDHIIALKAKRKDNTYYWNQDALGDPSSDEFKKAWALDNLQPLWAVDNWSKGNKYKGLL